MAVPVVMPTTPIERAWTLLAIAALIFAVAVLLFVVWQVFASVKATGFDADGVRCFAKAGSMTCIKTAEPPR
jgi:hypothetical protein